MSQAALSYSTPFDFETQRVRVVVENNSPWFVGKDVCAALGIKNHVDAIRRLNVDEKKGVVITDPLGKNAQKATGINEPGIYRLVFTSRVEAAERFKRWLAHDVLPSIRNTGSYVADNHEKPISVRQHKRRTSTPVDTAINLVRTATRLEAVADKIQPKAPDMCAMVINGESVFVDIHKFDGVGRAVTLEADGAIRIQHVEPSYSDYQPMGVRTALGARYHTVHGTTVRNGVTVLGMIMEQGQPLPVQPMQIEHELVKRVAVSIGHSNQSAPYRDKILALLGTGLSKTEIAEKVGCSYHGVDYWARKARRLG